MSSFIPASYYLRSQVILQDFVFVNNLVLGEILEDNIRGLRIIGIEVRANSKLEIEIWWSLLFVN